MNENSIINFIQKELLNGHNPIELTTEDDLLGSGLLDSIGIMQLIQFIENANGIKIPPEDMTIENFISVEAMEIYLQTLKPA